MRGVRVITLKGYAGERRGWPRFHFDLDDHSVKAEIVAGATQAQSAAAGVGTYIRTGGLFARRSTFVALYVIDGGLYLAVDGRRWDLLNDAKVERVPTALGLKRFRVLVGNSVEWQCSYFTIDYERFPDEDILWYVARSTSDRPTCIRTLLIWQDIANNQWEWSPAYHAQLGRRVLAYLAAAATPSDSN